MGGVYERKDEGGRIKDEGERILSLFFSIIAS
jgi:hypothetical protein